MTEAWIQRNSGTPEDRREYERERLIVRALDMLYGLMEDSELTQSELAERLGTSRAYVSQVFRGSRNVTLRTLSDFAWASGYRVGLNVEPLRGGEFISAPVQLVRPPRARIVKSGTTTVLDNRELIDVDPLAA